MVEIKKVWAVNHELEIVEKMAIVDGDKILAAKSPDAMQYGNEYYVLQYCDTEAEAKKWASDKEQEIRDMVPKVLKFIIDMDRRFHDLAKRMGIKKEDYLGNYAETTSYYNIYEEEKRYANKLITFIRSRMLNIGGHMIPINEVKDVKWYGGSSADEYEETDWKAVITTKDCEEYETKCEEDVRLIWNVLGFNSGSWFIDENIDYRKD